MSEAVKNLLKEVGVDFGEKDPKDNTGNVTLLKEENEQRRLNKENVKKNFLLKQRIKSPDKFLI